MTRIFLTSLWVVSLLGIPFAAGAHETITSGTLTVLLHVEPNHTPVVAEDAHLFFTVEDSAGTFDSDDCQCTISVSAHNKTLYSEGLPNTTSTTTKTSIVFNYAFPEKNVYLVTLAGTSTKNTFTPFSLTYSVRVDTERSITTTWLTKIFGSHAHHAPHFLLFGGGIIVGIILTIRDSRKKKRYNQSH